MSERIGPYEVLDVLGTGGQATTVRARGEEGGVVALKLFFQEDAAVAEHEARLLETVDDPHVARFLGTVEGVWRDEPVFGIAQQFIDGRSLQALIDERRFIAEADVVGIARQLLSVAQVLHDGEPPVVHRDIKPPNIIVTEDGHLFLVDFGGGIAGADQGDVVGTVGYTAPEQFFGEAGPQADLYSIGATLLHLVTRKHPSEFPMRDLRYELAGRLSCSASLERLIRRLLEPELDDRPSTATEAVRLLDAPIEDDPDHVIIERTPVSLVIDVPVALPRLMTPLVAMAMGAAFLMWMGLPQAILLAAIAGTFVHIFITDLLPIRRDRLELTKSNWTLTRSTFGIKERTEGEVRPGFAMHRRGDAVTLHDFESVIARGFGPAAAPRDIRRASAAVASFLADEHDEQVEFDFDENVDRQADQQLSQEAEARSSS